MTSTLFSGSLESSRILGQRGSRSIAQDILSGRKWAYIGSRGPGLTIQSNNASTSNIFGTLGDSGRTTSAFGAMTRMRSNPFTANVLAGGDGTQQFKRALMFYGACLIAFPNITNMGYWSGFFNGDPTNTPPIADPALLHIAGFRYVTSAGDTTFRCCTKDGTTLNNQDSGVTVAADTAYLLEVLVIPSGNIEFWINGSLVATSSANLPGSTTQLAAAGILMQTLSGAKDYDCGFVYNSQN